MTSISSTTSLPLQGMTGPGQRRDGGPVATAAKALGLSSSELQATLSSGKSLGDVADEQGVSRDDLAAALKAGAPADLAASSDADEKISLMIDQKGGPQGPKGAGGPHGRGGPQGPPPPSSSSSSSSGDETSGVLGGTLTDDQETTLGNLSTLLGTDADSLLSDLKKGTSLSDLVAKAGVSASSLASVVQDGLLIDTRA